jgi:hypothetical protein
MTPETPYCRNVRGVSGMIVLRVRGACISVPWVSWLSALLTVLVLVGLPEPTFAQLRDENGSQDSVCAIGHDEADTPLVTLGDLHGEVDKMLIHLNEAVFALSGNDVRIARTQFRQFFTSWDRADDSLAEIYPEKCAALDLEIEKLESSLLRFPEDLDASRLSLRALRAGALEIIHDLEERIQSQGADALLERQVSIGQGH